LGRLRINDETGQTMTVSAEHARNAVKPDLPLSSSEREEILQLAKYVTADPGRDPEGFCREARRAALHLPASLTEPLTDFHRSGSGTGVLVFSGFAVGGVPPTPGDNTRHLGQHTMLARVQAILNEFLGSMVAYQAEGGGLLFQDMVPSRRASFEQTSLSSAVELEVHTEQAFSELRPDYLSLACLRGDPMAQTFVLSARRLLDRCTQREAALLREPRWTTTIDASFLGQGHEFADGCVRGPMPILYGADDDPFLLLDQDLMRGADEASQQLLDHVAAIYLEERSAYTLRAGDVVILDNKRTAHGRSMFGARFDGTDRFVIRSFVVRDLNVSRHARAGDTRVILAAFS
jgi:L-asparagine oxygenase